MKRTDLEKAGLWLQKRCLPAALILLAALFFFTSGRNQKRRSGSIRMGTHG